LSFSLRLSVRPLGPLEARILDALWSGSGPLTGRQIHGAFPKLAYTTIMTTLDRLYRKGVLVRESSGRAFAYRVACSRQEWLREMAFDSLSDLLGEGGTNAMLSTFVSAVGKRDAALLDELEALVLSERVRLRGTQE
jgi:predicted transcriptional regulator